MENDKNMNKAGTNRKIKFVGGVLTAGLLMFGSASFAQDRDNVNNSDINEFNQYDSNTDQQWDRDEFNTRMQEDQTYDTWDTDRDGALNENEFNEGTRNWRDQRTQQGVNGQQDGTINTQGGTTDGAIDTNTNTGTFNDWDTDRDGALNRDEYNEGVYNNWDTNQDGSLDTDEYNEGINTYGTGTGTGTGTDLNEGTNDTNLNQGTGTDINNQGTGTGTGTDINNPGTGTGTGTGY